MGWKHSIAEIRYVGHSLYIKLTSWCGIFICCLLAVFDCFWPLSWCCSVSYWSLGLSGPGSPQKYNLTTNDKSNTEYLKVLCISMTSFVYSNFFLTNYDSKEIRLMFCYSFMKSSGYSLDIPDSLRNLLHHFQLIDCLVWIILVIPVEV